VIGARGPGRARRRVHAVVKCSRRVVAANSRAVLGLAAAQGAAAGAAVVPGRSDTLGNGRPET
jgi:hypothetical protein